MSQVTFAKKLGKQGCMPLVPVKLGKASKTDLVYYKIRTDSQYVDSLTYNKCIRTFETGDPEHWVSLLQDLQEVWIQNDIEDAIAKYNIVKSVLDGAAWTAFEAQVDLAQVLAAGMTIDEDDVGNGLVAVSNEIFPFRALEDQKKWMRNGLKNLLT